MYRFHYDANLLGRPQLPPLPNTGADDLLVLNCQFVERKQKSGSKEMQIAFWDKN